MKRLLSVILLLALFAPALSAQEPQTTQPRKERPKVGLVLSGGGAKGMAHIGALKIIEQTGLPIDYVVGTSIGSIIGGMYALGYDADELDSLVRAQDWNLLMKDQIRRKNVSYSFKEDADKYMLTIPFLNRKNLSDQAEAGPGANKGVLRNMPAALVQGQNLDQLFTKLSVGYQDDIDFNTLPIPFACVAVDLNTKEEVVWHSGSLVTAIRSSMSIPGYFTPVQVGDRYLVDGGMLNNLPVDVAREMGADYVVTIDLHQFDGGDKPVDQTIPEMISTMLSIMNGEKYYSGRRNSDIIISPNTGDFGVLSFDDRSVNALVDSGTVAAQRVLPQLQSLANYLKEFPERDKPRAPKAHDFNHDTVMISQVEISGADSQEMSWMLSKTDIRPGKAISGEDMDKAMAFIYNTKAFTKASYRVIGNDEQGYGLKVAFTPQRLHQAGIGFRFDSEEMASILLGVNLNKRKLFGSKLDFELELGANSNALLRYGYTFPNMTRLNVSVAGKFTGVNFYEYQPVNVDNKVVEAYSLSYTDRYTVFVGQADYQITGWLDADIDLGVQYVNFKCMNIDGKPATNDSGSGNIYTNGIGRGFLSWRFDSMDQMYFPTRGLKIDIIGDARYHFKNRDWGFDPQFNLIAAIPLGRKVTLIPQTYNRWIFGNDSHRYYANMVGSYMAGRYVPWHLPFVGINHTFDASWRVDIARLDLRVNLFKQHYLTLMGNYMANWDYTPGFDLMLENYYGFGAGYSINTIVGPVKLIAHWSNLSKRVGFYFSLGYDF